jgi:hypothetical protein
VIAIDSGAILRIARPIINFTGEGIDRAVRALEPLVRPEERRLLEPVLRREHAGLADELHALPWDRPEAAVEQGLKILMRETRPCGVLDPSVDDADIPWCIVLVLLAEAPLLGSRTARRWFSHLYRLQLGEDAPVSVVVEATAAYAVAAFELLVGRHHEAARWAETASIVSEHDDRPMIGLIAYVRAVRLLKPLLGRCPRPSP